MTTAADYLLRDFATYPDVIRAHAAERPNHMAVIDGARSITYGAFNALCERVAAGLQRDGVQQGDAIAIVGPSSIEYAAVFLGAVYAGVAASPLSPSATPEGLALMIRDSGAKIIFCDDANSAVLDTIAEKLPARRVALEGEASPSLESWLPPAGAKPQPVAIQPDDPFNIIYSSGTTGAPKGIVQPHQMRWGHVRRGDNLLYGPQAVTITSTPLYSNTTLVSFFPTLVRGGTVVLMRKFDARQFLELSQKHRATHAMLVPVQYRRIMDLPDFETFDLSAYQMKTCTSAPFAADLKADILKRWPGGLVEFYGMTEGGGSCILWAHLHPDKLNSVGPAAAGHDIRVIDETGKEAPRGELGEVVGRSGNMMLGYHNQPGKTSEAQWVSPEGHVFIRTGDVGRFDEDGFMVLGDRKKDMIISGGFNIYPSDLEAELIKHPAVKESAVVGIPSREWGETPAAFVVLRSGHDIDSEALRKWVNERVGKMQRLSYLVFTDALPRSSIGKVLKRELRDGFKPSAG
jgi:acyl-CoA synthetase (AMP-forming)/AMP-acid ligase II